MLASSEDLGRDTRTVGDVLSQQRTPVRDRRREDLGVNVCTTFVRASSTNTPPNPAPFYGLRTSVKSLMIAKSAVLSVSSGTPWTLAVAASTRSTARRRG